MLDTTCSTYYYSYDDGLRSSDSKIKAISLANKRPHSHTHYIQKGKAVSKSRIPIDCFGLVRSLNG